MLLSSQSFFRSALLLMHRSRTSRSRHNSRKHPLKVIQFIYSQSFKPLVDIALVPIWCWLTVWALGASTACGQFSLGILLYSWKIFRKSVCIPRVILIIPVHCQRTGQILHTANTSTQLTHHFLVYKLQ